MRAKRLATTVYIAILGIAGCSHLDPATALPSANPTLVRTATAGGYKVLQNFDLFRNAAFPNGGLTLVDGEFYGVAFDGGGSRCRCGAVFSVTPMGRLKIIYSFKGSPDDGSLPQGPLLLLNGKLYGTTYAGGVGSCGFEAGCGTVFVVTTAGVEKVLYRFTDYSDGARPNGGLATVNGTLYGTASVGGDSEGWGTIFSITISGTKKNVYEFEGGSDGEVPSNAPLLAIGNLLYGTTLYGGISGDNCSHYGGCGTVYKVTPSGHETVLHEFSGDTTCEKKSKDGAMPAGALTAVRNTIYGTTTYGGTCSSLGFSLGTVFTMTTGGKESPVHDFNLTDGALPATPLTYANGVLYGTTGFGGSPSCPASSCDGVIFSMSKAGKENALYTFKGRKYDDGATASGALTPLNGKLYGVTTYGGKNSGSSWRGYGTFFEISP
jgi:uncharacterized repeat protein (TIGR03803 family)